MGEEADDTFVWGTNLTVGSICGSVRRLLQHFRLSPHDAEAKYISLLRQVRCRSAPFSTHRHARSRCRSARLPNYWVRGAASPCSGAGAPLGCQGLSAAGLTDSSIGPKL